MGATEEAAAVLWVDVYVVYHYPCTTEPNRYCCNGAMRTMLFYFIVQGKNHNKYCSGNAAKRQLCI